MTLAFAGLVAGVVHVLSGPDHLAAIAPFAVADTGSQLEDRSPMGTRPRAGVLGVGLLVLLSRHALPIEACLRGARPGGSRSDRDRDLGHARRLLRPDPRPPAHEHRHAHGHAALGGRDAPRIGGQLSSAGDPAGACPSLGLRRGRLSSSLRRGQRRSDGGVRVARRLGRGPAACQRAAAQRALLCVCSAIAVLVGGFWLLEGPVIHAAHPCAQHVSDALDVIVIGAGPAGVLAAIRAADLGARTALVTSAEFGGMAANEGPVPVRTLAYAARLLRDARQLPRYGITGSEPVLQFDRLLARVREVVQDVRAHSALRERIDALGVTVHEHCGPVRFTGPNSIETGRDSGSKRRSSSSAPGA